MKGLRQRVEKIKATIQPPESSNEDCSFFNLFGGNGDNEDEDEEEKEASIPSPSAPSVVLEDAPIPEDIPVAEHLIDATIDSKWTGRTPQAVLQELCQKRRLSRPKLTKLPFGQGYSMTVTTQTSKKQKSSATFVAYNRDFVPTSSLPDYLATKALYEMEPTMPLYHVLPPGFRRIWLSWVQHVEDVKNEASAHQEKAKEERIQYLLSLIPETPEASPLSIQVIEDDDVQNHGSDRQGWDAHSTLPSSSSTSPSSSLRVDNLGEKFSRRMSTRAYQEMSRIRQALPMASYKQTLLETVRDNRVTIISAQTGAGKTTQCPQFLLEDALLDGRGREIQILVTQPRRVAATSVAERVSEEMCEPRLGGLVGYQIRMEAVRSAGTKLLFCTTGIVLRRLQDDRTLKGVVRSRFSRGWHISLFARHQSFPTVSSCL